MAQGPEVVQGGRAQGADWWLGAFLELELGDVAIVLHDLRVPGSHASIDHVVVAPSGVWVVDATWRNDFKLDPDGCGGTVRVDAMERRIRVVAAAVGRAKEVPIRAALCFGAAHWGGTPHPFWIEGVLITHPADLVERVGAAGPLDEDMLGWIAARLALA
jgi:hypothetical protein